MEIKLIVLGFACLVLGGGAIFYFNEQEITAPSLSSRATWRLQEIDTDGTVEPAEEYITTHTMYIDLAAGKFRHDEATYDADLVKSWYEPEGMYSTNELNVPLVTDLGVEAPEDYVDIPDECIFIDSDDSGETIELTQEQAIADIDLVSCDESTCTWVILGGSADPFVYVENKETRTPLSLNGFTVLEYTPEIVGDPFVLPDICKSQETIRHLIPTTLNTTEENWAQQGDPSGGGRRLLEAHDENSKDGRQLSDEYKREFLGMDIPKTKGKHVSPLGFRLSGTKWCGNNNEFTKPNAGPYGDCTGKTDVGTKPHNLFALAGPPRTNKFIAGQITTNLPYDLRNYFVTRSQLLSGNDAPEHPSQGPYGQRLKNCVALDKDDNGNDIGVGLQANGQSDDKICRAHDFCPHSTLKWAMVSMRKKAHPTKACSCDQHVWKYGGTYKWETRVPFLMNGAYNPCSNLKLKCRKRNWRLKCVGGWAWKWAYQRIQKYKPGPNNGYKMFSRAGRQDWSQQTDPTSAGIPMCAPLRLRGNTGSIPNNSIGDGKCDASLNNEADGYDGGDCCASTCILGINIPPLPQYTCGSAGYNCIQPGCTITIPTPAPSTPPPTPFVKPGKV